MTINRTAGTWFAAFCIEDGQQPPPVKDGRTIGVDVDVGTMASGIRQLRRLDKAIAI